MLAGGTSRIAPLGPDDEAKSLACTRLMERCHIAAESQPLAVEFER